MKAFLLVAVSVAISIVFFATLGLVNYGSAYTTIAIDAFGGASTRIFPLVAVSSLGVLLLYILSIFGEYGTSQYAERQRWIRLLTPAIPIITSILLVYNYVSYFGTVRESLDCSGLPLASSSSVSQGLSPVSREECEQLDVYIQDGGTLSPIASSQKQQLVVSGGISVLGATAITVHFTRKANRNLRSYTRSTR